MNVEWLTSDQGQQVILKASEFDDTLKANATVRKAFNDISPDLISQAITQAELRRTLAQRWRTDVSSLLLTHDGVSQATRPSIAKYRAQWIKHKFGDKARVLDLTCGLGFDALAFARAGLRVHAIELDEITAQCAMHNLKSVNVPVEIGDALNANIQDFDVVFVDPARRNPKAPKRTDGTTPRILDPNLWSPSWDFISSLAERIPVVAKVAPGISDGIIAQWDAHWVSIDGDVVEAMVSFPSDVQKPARSATLIDSTTDTISTFAGGATPPTKSDGKFLVSPDGAITRASALDELASLVNGGLVNEHIGWIYSDDENAIASLRNTVPSPADCFEILDRTKCDAKALAIAIRNLPASGITIMTRGVNVDVDLFRKKIGKQLDRTAPELVLALYRDDAGNVALVCRRL